jgi:hypothetical protein
MATKVTLYIRDDELWGRARQVSGPGGLSKLVHHCLQQWLERPELTASTPSLLERARRLRQEAEALVRAVEGEDQSRGPIRKRQSRRRPPA